ncbi:hypothetical protein [Nocardioides sp. T2.26MG-1]|uniref:hypothetical protein n=1 Tax=Nocardioides sp. T2.26MG-1 TaxID=3041166 RepID=UPI002477668E|nr:hypothetical protein [Nocardioides sp. T2.26MG-1]CAI9401895.1 hypothetical protein HIDPHFAB_00702 [Nocardioides sp. T2.26MG-1]
MTQNCRATGLTEEQIADVRSQHVVDRLAEAVRVGLTSPAEVEHLAQRLRDGEDAGEIRRTVNALARRARTIEAAREQPRG